MPASGGELLPSMYCKRCDYPLHSLSQTLCPECGWPFDPDNPRTYHRRPWRRVARRWCRIVAIVLAVIPLATLAVGASVWGWFYLGWQVEQPIIAAIQASGGKVSCHPGRSGDWLQDLYGGPGSALGFAFDRARRATLRADPACVTLQPLTKLGSLWLNGPGVTDKSLRLPATAPALGYIAVVGASITNSGLDYLRSMSRPYHVILGSVPLDDSAVPYLSRLRNVTAIDIIDTRMTPDGIRQLERMLPGTKIWTGPDDIGAKGLKGPAT